MCVAIVTAAHATASSDLDESGWKHVFLYIKTSHQVLLSLKLMVTLVHIILESKFVSIGILDVQLRCLFAQGSKSQFPVENGMFLQIYSSLIISLDVF